MPKLLTDKSRRLTDYAMHCGYVEYKSTNHDGFRQFDLCTEMYVEHGTYHVRQFDRRDGAVIFRTLWESFPNVRQARDFFGRQPGKLYRHHKKP